MIKQDAARPTQAMGDRLRSEREARGRSTQAVAEQAGISTGYLFKLENGYVGTPSPRVLYRLADTLGLDYWELIGLAGYPVPAVPAGVSDPAPAGAAANAAGPAAIPLATGPLNTMDRIADLLAGIHQELGAIRRALETGGDRPIAP